MRREEQADIAGAMSVVLCALALGYWGVSRSFWVENRQAGAVPCTRFGIVFPGEINSEIRSWGSL